MDANRPEPHPDVALRAEALRARYRPDPIKVLFVGESAPAGGRFFYATTGQVFQSFKQALAPDLGGSDAFLDRFRDAGLYLDDLVLTPVNHLTPQQRMARNADAAPALAARIASYQPRVIVGFAKRIALPLAQAHARSGVACPLHIVSFPGNGQQANFRRELAEILPSLMAVARA